MSLEWGTESCLQLIDEFEKRPVLWNRKNEFYYLQSKKNEAWHQIGEKMCVEPEQAKQKMCSLMGSFRREKSRGKKKVVTKTGQYEIGLLFLLIVLFLLQVVKKHMFRNGSLSIG